MESKISLASNVMYQILNVKIILGSRTQQRITSERVKNDTKRNLVNEHGGV